MSLFMMAEDDVCSRQTTRTIIDPGRGEPPEKAYEGRALDDFWDALPDGK